MKDPRAPGAAAVGIAGGALLLLLFGAVAARHGVNADEGFYVLAGLRVLAGELPYVDFFFPQMPYLPLATAVALVPFDASLTAGRLVSVFPGAMLGGLLAAVARRRNGRFGVALAVLVLYAAWAPNLHYLTVAKTYGLANLALVAAFLLVAGGGGVRPAFAAGICAAVALGTRLPVLPVVVLLAWWQWRSGRARLAAFAAGAVAGGLPCLVLFVADPAAFWFNNVGFHDLRREMVGWESILAQKAEVLGKWLFLPQNLVLWAAALAGVWLDRRVSLRPLLCALGLAALYLYATPTYLEYMVQMVPFLLLAALPALAVLLSRRGLAALAATVYAAGLFVALRPTDPDSERGRKLALWDLERVEDVAAAIARATEPGDRVLSWWEGYPWLAGRAGYAGVGFWESNVAKKLDPAARARHHVAGVEQVRALVRAGDPGAVVFPEGTWDFLVPELAGRYAEAQRIGVVRVFRRSEGSGAAAPRAGEAS